MDVHRPIPPQKRAQKAPVGRKRMPGPGTRAARAAGRKPHPGTAKDRCGRPGPGRPAQRAAGVPRRDGGDRPLASGYNAFLHLRYLRDQSGLVADGGRHSPEQAGNLAAGLDVQDANGLPEAHQQAVLAGHGQAAVGCMPRVIASFISDLDPIGLDAECLSSSFVMPFFLDYSGPNP